MTARVFISYAHRDEGFARQLAQSLAGQGVAGFADQADVAAGAPWGEAVRNALSAADTMVFVVSGAALSSNFVMAELGAAAALGKRIVAIKPPNEALPDLLPPVLDRAQVLDAKGLSQEEIMARVQQLAA